MEPNKKIRTARAVLIGLGVFCFGLLLVAFEGLVSVHHITTSAEESRAFLQVFSLSFAGMVILGVWVFILTRRRDLWSCLIDASESFRLSRALPVIMGRRFFESRLFTILVCVLFGLFVLATVATVVAYLYFNGT